MPQRCFHWGTGKGRCDLKSVLHGIRLAPSEGTPFGRVTSELNAALTSKRAKIMSLESVTCTFSTLDSPRTSGNLGASTTKPQRSPKHVDRRAKIIKD